MSVPPTGSDVPPSAYPGGVAQLTQDEKTMAMLAYILGIFTSFIGPLVIWLIKKDQSKFVNYHGLQALLLHAVVAVGYFLGGILSAVIIGLVFFPIFGLLGLIFSIIAGMAANRGEWYEMPVIGKFARQNAGV